MVLLLHAQDPWRLNALPVFTPTEIFQLGGEQLPHPLRGFTHYIWLWMQTFVLSSGSEGFAMILSLGPGGLTL